MAYPNPNSNQSWLTNWSDGNDQNSMMSSLSGFGKKSTLPAWAMPQSSGAMGNPVGSLGSGTYDTGDIYSGGGGVGAVLSEDRGLFSSALQKTYADKSTGGGYLTAGLGIAQGLGNLWMGKQQLAATKAALSEGKRQFEMDYGAKQKMANMQIEDKMTLAKAEGRDGSYMEKYRI